MGLALYEMLTGQFADGSPLEPLPLSSSSRAAWSIASSAS